MRAAGDFLSLLSYEGLVAMVAEGKAFMLAELAAGRLDEFTAAANKLHR